VLSFKVYGQSDAGDAPQLTGAYLMGADGIPARGNISFENDAIRCESRSDEPLALSLLWQVDGFGQVQLETTRLPLRKEPYILSVELARHRLMRINVKREEWGLFDYPGMDQIIERIDQARDLFVKALQHLDTPEQADDYARQSLRASLPVSEDMSLFHADVFLNRRRQLRGFNHPMLGVRIPLDKQSQDLAAHLPKTFDFACVPATWRAIEPKENERSFATVDQAVKAARSAKLAVHGGPLLSLSVSSLPDWMYIWENDPDTIFDLARAHVKSTVKRYAKDVRTWIACSGLHANDTLSLNFEHMLELTRLACSEARRAAPQSKILIELTQPWGEYFARNPRTIPPVVYAEMVAQSGIGFDGFGLQFMFGIDSAGYRLRDMLQISSLIDRLANLGKPLHVTGVCVPSQPVEDGGVWLNEWTADRQAEWLYRFTEVVLSRPFVESVCFQTACDFDADPCAGGGLFTKTLEAKPVVDRLANFRRTQRDQPA
jgi:hypothetical protein